MQSHFLKPLVILFYVFLLIACSNEQQKQKSRTPDFHSMQGPLEYANKQLIKTEDEEINNFIARYKWKMSTSGTGLRYNIYSSGNGKKAAPGSKVKINYVVRLINGDIIYSSEINGPREFIIGKSNAEPGLEEAVLLMRQGDRAKLIIPSHLAFGLHGDENKVPKRATLIYDLEILSINDQ